MTHSDALEFTKVALNAGEARAAAGLLSESGMRRLGFLSKDQFTPKGINAVREWNNLEAPPFRPCRIPR